jgi:hypothetical protein
MLATRNRFSRNPYFQFHPLHSLYALVAVLVVFGLFSWFALTARRGGCVSALPLLLGVASRDSRGGCRHMSCGVPLNARSTPLE